jgi:hypothetical protein
MTKSSGTILDGECRPEGQGAGTAPCTKSSGTILDGECRPEGLGFGLGHGFGAHAPDEFYLVDSTHSKVQGLDGAVASFVECLYALA